MCASESGFRESPWIWALRHIRIDNQRIAKMNVGTLVSIEGNKREKTHGYSCAVGPTGLGLINRDGGIIPK